MTSDNALRYLSLVVDNPQALQQGSRPGHLFDAEGGTIGSQGAQWTLADSNDRVSPLHCEILHEDGGFLIVDRSGKTRVNDQTQPLGAGACARLSNGDRLHIGPYRIAVRLGNDFSHMNESAGHPGDFSADVLETLPEAEAQEVDASYPSPAGWAEFKALGESTAHKGLLDPLQALDVALDGSSANLDPHHYGHTPLAAQADVAATRSEAIYGAPMHAPGEPYMSEQDIQPAAAREWIQRQRSSNAEPVGLIEPLVEGIGAPVGVVDDQEAYVLLSETGRAVGALIRGLCALNTPQAGEQQRMSLAGRTLQPIEDNPLRLGQSYPDTVRALFSAERSVVHLSPAAAVEESLEQLRRQQVATHQAISAGLAALLQAFSPEQLERRFQRYQRARDGQAQAAERAWQMYGYYYDELTSGRQQGFDKLFWEVFEQAFDQALRAEA